MTFAYETSIGTPDQELEIVHYSFSADLRQFFPKLESNHDIEKLLRERGVILESDQTDSEYSCLWAYFSTEEAAKAFLARLNEVPEIKNYVPEDAPYVALTSEDWKKLTGFLKATLTNEQYSKLTALNIQVQGATEIA